MLTHSIDKYETVVSSYAPVRTNRSQIKTQEQYDAWLALQFKPGAFIRFNVNSVSNVTNRWMINYVMAIEPDFAKLTFSSTGMPESHLLVQVGDLNKATSWVRWSAPMEYQEIEPVLTMQFIDDHVLNYFKDFSVAEAKARIRVF